MKKWLSLVVVVVVLAGLSGCGKKQEAEELQPITIDALGNSGTSQAPLVLPVDSKAQDVKALAVSASATTKEVIPVTPQGPYKPTGTEIQTALKNAGFYAGSIDGKIGPKSKKAIEDFQSANGLKVDGKVGPKTWEVLSRHLSAVVEPSKR